MKKFVSVLVIIAIIAAAGIGGYFIADKGLLKPEEPQTVDEEKLYTYYLNSTEAEKYYHLLEDDANPLYKYSGEKEIVFEDIDNDGVSECLLRVKYLQVTEGEEPFDNNEEQICIFDIDDENVRFVMASELCAPYRTGEKFRLIKTDSDEYKIFRYMREANKTLQGTVYSYDGKTMKLEKSFFADIYPIAHDTPTFYTSTANDLYDYNAANYANYDAAEKITEDEFYTQWNYYELDAVCVYQSPEHTEPN